MVLIGGEPGIGKTSLAGQFGRAVHQDGIPVVYGRCYDDSAVPYGPWWQVLRSLIPEGGDGHGASDAGDLRGLLQASGHAATATSIDPETARYLLFGAVRHALADAAAERGLVVVLDDLHWSDAESLQLLRHLASGESPLRVLIVGTVRDSEAAAGGVLASFLAAMRRESSRDASRAARAERRRGPRVDGGRAGHEMDEEGVALRDALLAETDGNPFFIGELLRHLSETNAIVQTDDGRWIGTATLAIEGLPASLREIITDRVNRLGPRTAAGVLTTASVIGREFDFDLLVRASGTDDDSLLTILDQAEAVALVRELTSDAGRYAFVHALIQHTLYEQLGAARRARTHRRVAEAIEELTGTDPSSRVVELAHHWASATVPSDVFKAVGYSIDAGNAALVALAPDEALRHYNRARDLCLQAHLERRATVHRRAGRPGHGATPSGQSALPGHPDDGRSSRRSATDDVDRLVGAALAADRGFYSLDGPDRHGPRRRAALGPHGAPDLRQPPTSPSAGDAGQRADVGGPDRRASPAGVGSDGHRTPAR